MKTDRAKHNRSAKEKVDTKADLQRQINALNAQVSDLQLNRPKNGEQSQKKRTTLEKEFNQLDAVISTHPPMIQFAVNEQSREVHGSRTISTGAHRVFSGVVQMQFTSLLCFVYLVAGTTLKDQIDIKVSAFLRNVCEEEHVEEHTQVVDSCDTKEASNTVQVLTPATSAKLAHYQRHKGWCDTELTTNTQTKAEETATVEKPHATVDELKVSMENLVEEETDDVIERDKSQTMSKSITDEIEDDSSQQEFRRVRSIFERALHVEYQNVSLWLKYLEMEVLNKQRFDCAEVVKKAPHDYDTWFEYIKLEEDLTDVYDRTIANFSLTELQTSLVACETEQLQIQQTINETISLRQLDETSLKGNVKECNAMSVELDEKCYIKFAQFEQRQKEMDRNTMKTINVKTDQSKRKIVIRMT